MRAILTYHSVDSSRSPISIDEASFRAHVDWFATGGVRVVSLEELLALPGEAHAVAPTFDDAFENFASLAWPLLREHGLPVTLFVPTGHAGGSNDWDRGRPALPHLPLCGWDVLGRLAEEGVALGAHTVTHADLPTLGDLRLVEELAGCAERLFCETGRRPDSLAYPYGRVSDRVVREAARVFDRACTTDLRLLGPREDPMRLPRLDAFYLRDGRWMSRWGTADLERRIWVRARARRVRFLLTEAEVVR